MTEESSALTWLTIPELVERLGLTQSQVRRMIEDRQLAAVRVNGKLAVPDVFLNGDEPLPVLRGTLILLGDQGFSNDEAVEWLLAPEDSLGSSPIDAIRAGRKTEVRRVAQALA